MFFQHFTVVIRRHSLSYRKFIPYVVMVLVFPLECINGCCIPLFSGITGVCTWCIACLGWSLRIWNRQHIKPLMTWVWLGYRFKISQWYLLSSTSIFPTSENPISSLILQRCQPLINQAPFLNRTPQTGMHLLWLKFGNPKSRKDCIWTNYHPSCPTFIEPACFLHRPTFYEVPLAPGDFGTPPQWPDPPPAAPAPAPGWATDWDGSGDPGRHHRGSCRVSDGSSPAGCDNSELVHKLHGQYIYRFGSISM